MKNLVRLFTLLFLLAIISACKKEHVSNPDKDYMVYTGSRGIIGKGGGRIRFTDLNSPLNGANLIIPEGALSENTSLSLEMDNSVRSTIDTLASILSLEPDGLVFNKPVELKMVRKELVNPRVYYFLPDSDSVEEICITYIDGNDGFVTVNLDHFSHYLDTEVDNGNFEAEIIKTASSMKAAIQFGGILNEKLTLAKIPVRKRADIRPPDITNALEAIFSGQPIDPNTLHASIKVTLKEGKLPNPLPIKTLGFDVFRNGNDINNFNVKVVKTEPAGGRVFTHYNIGSTDS